METVTKGDTSKAADARLAADRKGTRGRNRGEGTYLLTQTDRR